MRLSLLVELRRLDQGWPLRGQNIPLPTFFTRTFATVRLTTVLKLFWFEPNPHSFWKATQVCRSLAAIDGSLVAFHLDLLRGELEV